MVLGFPEISTQQSLDFSGVKKLEKVNK